jgi:hypothetical protein
MHVIAEAYVFKHKTKMKNFKIIKISRSDKSVDNFHCSENVNGAS